MERQLTGMMNDTMTGTRRAALAGWCWLAVCGLNAEQPRGLTEIPDPSVEAQLAAFSVPEGFEINLFAAEPMLRKPVQMNWDADGRLWVVSSTTYPQIGVGATPADEVVVLEDTNGDGKADKSTVFADGLHIPTAVVPGDGGAYVANSTELLFLRDTTGDGKADERTVMLSGFGTEDTHHLLHTLRWGPEGLLYFLQSIYIHSHVETPHGVRRLMGGGVWEFRPETRRLEVLSKGLINPWGFEFDRWGQSFAVDGAGSEGVNFIFPGSVFATSPGASRILRGMSPGQPKHCGLEIVEDPHFPEDWQENLVCCDFRGNRVNRFRLERSGSGFAARQLPDVLASTHRAFRPIDVKIGPDGALYIADWFNPIIQHGEVDFRDPRRDQTHGRIWRLSAKGRPASQRVRLTELESPKLVEHLASDRRWIRNQVRLEMRRRGEAAVLQSLRDWKGMQDPATEEGLHALLEGAWAREGVNAFLPELWRKIWASGDARARAAALRILCHRWRELEDTQEVLEEAAKDGDALVRLWAVAVAATSRRVAHLRAVMPVLDSPMDEQLDFLLEQTCRELSPRWLPEYLEEKMNFGSPMANAYALRSAGQPTAVRALLGLVEEGKLAPEDLPAVFKAAGDAMDAAGAERLAKLIESPAIGAHRQEAMDVLLRAADARKIAPKSAAGLVEKWMGAEDEATRSGGVRLAGGWKVAAARPRLEEWVRGADMDAALRAEAAAALASLGGAEARAVFDEVLMAAPLDDTATRGLMVSSLARVAPNLAAKRTAEFLASVKDASHASAVMSTVLQDKKLPELVAAELAGKTLDAGVAAEALRMAGTRGASQDLQDALTAAGGIRRMDRALSDEEMGALVEKVNHEGDPARGEQIYRRANLLCISCHAIGDAGGVLGPNMVSIGASAPVDYLIESLLDPSAKIKEGYHMVVVNTKGGQVYSGLLEKDGDQELVIRDPSNELRKVPQAEVAAKQLSPVSMMPAGLTAGLREDEFVDLVKFLSELGREGDYKVSARRFVRSWRGMGEMDQAQIDKVRHTGLQVLNEEGAGLPWRMLTSLVSGEAPLHELPVAQRMYPWHPRILQFRLNQPASGTVRLGLSQVEGIVMVAGETILQELSPEMELELPAGVTAVSLLVTRPVIDLERLSVEILEGAAEVAP
jgi:putative heme-binding domain-containing protein